VNKKYKAKGYNLYRNSTNKVFAYAVVFKNFGCQDFPEGNLVADFHINRKLAEANVRKINRLSHLEYLEIVEVEEVA